MKKIWLVKQESNIDGEIYFNVVPCKDLKTAKQVFKDEIDTILNESHHFGGYTEEERKEAFEIENDGDTHFLINDPCDDYYEDIHIVQKEII